jgi:trans-aconitate methyltransferase
MTCRFCANPLSKVFLDLGSAPLSNAFLTEKALNEPEPFYPLKLFTCDKCWLVQLEEVQSRATVFPPDYVYYSSFSTSWLEHAERYVEYASSRLNLNGESLVVEIASNDGYLLQYVAARGIPCLGIEPTEGTAEAARKKGIETIVNFFGQKLAQNLAEQRGLADLIIANNVLAHVPDINDFVGGLSVLLDSSGTVTAEFPHLLQLVAHRQFDTVYHEHFSYFSLHTICKIFSAHGLKIWDVEQLPTHGGSLRIWASHHREARNENESVSRILSLEVSSGMLNSNYYDNFQIQADSVKNEFLEFLLMQKRAGRKVAGYGAAAKGNTLINYGGIKPDLLPYVVDASPHKCGRWLPGSRIPVVHESRIRAEKPDFIVVLPWNLQSEITRQLAYTAEWGCQFVVAVPRLAII